MARFFQAFLALLFGLVWPLSLEAEESASNMKRLAPLRNIPLPGEAALDSERPNRNAVENLMGKAVARVSAPGAPAGFDPVSDADIPLGIKFNRSIVRGAVRRLWDTGRYRDVKISARLLTNTTIELQIDIAPMLRIGQLTIRGNKALDRDDIERAIEYTPGRTILPDPEVLRGFRHKLLQLYQESGYRETRAALSILTTETAGMVELVVDIEEGIPDRYSSIHVEGLPKDISPNIINIKKGTVRNKEVIERKIQRFIEKLAEEGYVDAKTAPFQERRLSRYEMALTIPVIPGIKTSLDFLGNQHFLSRDLEAFVEKDGPVKSDTKSITRTQERLAVHLRTYGFLFAEIAARRKCIYNDKRTSQPIEIQCRDAARRQIVEFGIKEGPNVEVLNVLFDGNKWFSDKELEEELFAFIAEKNKNEDMLQPINSETLNHLGLSDKETTHAPQKQGIKAPRYRRTRVYDPLQYQEAAEHLTGIYQEQGFLSVIVDDTCDNTAHRPIEYRGTAFSPLSIQRNTGKEKDNDAPPPEKVPCVLYNKEKKQLLVTIRIDESAQTTISEIAFEGNRYFSSKDLLANTGLSVSEPYNEYQLKQSARKIADLYRSKGYMFAEVTFDKFFSDDMQRARIVYTVNEGPETRVGLIRIEGAETTASRLISDVISLESGAVITPDALEKSQMKLMDLGIFDGATVQMVSPEVPEPVKNIKIQVSEAKPQYLELRWGVATVEGLRSSFEYGYNNIAGWALSATLRARANYRLFFVGTPDFEERYKAMSLTDQLEHHVLVGLGSPHLIGTKGLFGWGIDAIKERLNKPGFSASRFTTFLRLNSKVALGTDYPHGLVFYGRTGLEFNLDISSGQNLDNPYLLQYLRLPEGRSTFYVAGLSVTLDLRDSPFNPTRGFFFSIGGDWVYSLPFFQNNQEQIVQGEPVTITDRSNLIRAEATASGYVPIFKTGVVFALSFSGGYIFHLMNKSQAWPDRYFYVGGIDTLRGFPEDSLIPQDVYEEWKNSLNDYGEDVDGLLNYRGGQVMFITRAELRYPLARGFLGAIFAEAGNLWRQKKNVDIIHFQPNFEINLRPVAGIGIRYQTPLGPVSFDLGINLDRRPTEEPFSWYISIGTAF